MSGSVPGQAVTAGNFANDVSTTTRFKTASCSFVRCLARPGAGPILVTAPPVVIVTVNGMMFPPTRPNAKPVCGEASKAARRSGTIVCRRYPGRRAARVHPPGCPRPRRLRRRFLVVAAEGAVPARQADEEGAAALRRHVPHDQGRLRRQRPPYVGR